MPDFLKALYRRFYNWWWPIPSDEKIVEIVKSLSTGKQSEIDAQISGTSKPSQQVCLISFSTGDQDICIPTIRNVTDCEEAAARINRQSGRTDAVGNMIDGQCPTGSKSIRPAP